MKNLNPLPQIDWSTILGEKELTVLTDEIWKACFKVRPDLMTYLKAKYPHDFKRITKSI